MNYTLKQLNRLRWSVLIVVLAGIGASIAMNVLHAPDSWVARGVAAGPPIAVFAALEMIVRIPSSGRWPTIIRIVGAFLIASGAAAISYAQQKAAVMALGFAEWESFIWPTIIDGLMIVASVSLVEVVRHIRNVTNGLTAVDGAPLPEQVRVVQPQVEESAEVLEYRAAMARRRTEGALVGLNVKSKAVK
jgi:hypothetical protein